MTERVVFRPDRLVSAVPFDELGRTEEGAWGIVDEATWLAADDGGALALLYLTRAEYEHAERKLSSPETARAVRQQLTIFSPRVAAKAMGLIEAQVRDAIAAFGKTQEDASTRAELFVALASFTTVPRFWGTMSSALIQLLQEGDASIIAELDSPSLQESGDLDPTGDERETRRRFATTLGELAARRGRPGKPSLLPYFDVERVYFVTPPPHELEAAAREFHDPTTRFRDGLLIPLRERSVGDIAAQGHQARVVFPTRGQYLGASAGLTPAQLEVEIDERLTSPGFATYLGALRMKQATLRAAAHVIAGADSDLAELLSAHSAEEASKLGWWLPAGGRAATEASAGSKLRRAAGVADFLVAFCRRRGTLKEAGNIEALARALSHVAGRSGS